jgi:hypothetical protein
MESGRFEFDWAWDAAVMLVSGVEWLELDQIVSEVTVHAAAAAVWPYLVTSVMILGLLRLLWCRLCAAVPFFVLLLP